MLSLSRKLGESFILHDNEGKMIGRVQFVSRSGNQVVMGFDFPKSIRVDREENLSQDELWDLEESLEEQKDALT